MSTQFLKNSSITRWFFVFTFLHVIAWTLAPFLIRFNLPMDSIEGAIWGHQLEWGYDKNPFMNGWLTALALKIDGSTGWAIYLFSQLSVAICFWAVWELGKKMLSPVYALLAVLLLEGMQYYNFHAIDFNDNTLELSIWALTTLFFYHALTRNKFFDWLLTGFFAALGMMTKYYTIILLFPMFLFLLFHPIGREQFKKPALYVGLLVFIAIITPHIFWLFSHNFITLNYAFNRVASAPSWINHLFFPAQFAWQIFEVIVPTLFLILLLFISDSKRPAAQLPIYPLTQFDKQFLFFVGMGPFLLTVLLSAVTGIKLRAGWGQPLLSLWSLILIAWLQPYLDLTAKKFYRFLVIMIVFLALTVTAYSIALIRAAEPSSANYPGKTIAATVTERWHHQYSTPILYIAGARWIAGNIAFYSKDHPQVYIDWNPEVSPWIDEEKLKKQGAVFVWELQENQKNLINEINKIKMRFKKMKPPVLYSFNWLRNKNMAPVRVLVAFLPPELHN
jgi:4-amino-4-deoxy-L-arabinose transferase-like glycosyltransferase